MLVPMAKLQPGDRVGRYEILECLGQSCYTGYAVHLATGDLSHIRLLMKRFEIDSDFYQLFTQEAELGEQLLHPNIAQLYEVASDGGYPFMIYEYVFGESVARLAKRRRFPVPAVLTLATAVASALDYAHNLKASDETPLQITHGGISPRTVLVSYQGDVKLIDFECRRLCCARTDFQYLAPEQVRGQRIDARSDVYSLGAVLCELLTGRSPFKRRSEVATLKAILQTPLSGELKQALDHLDGSPELGQVVIAALERDPAQRPQTAGELKSALVAAARRSRFEGSPRTLAQLFQPQTLGTAGA